MGHVDLQILNNLAGLSEPHSGLLRGNNRHHSRFNQAESVYHPRSASAEMVHAQEIKGYTPSEKFSQQEIQVTSSGNNTTSEFLHKGNIGVGQAELQQLKFGLT